MPTSKVSVLLALNLKRLRAARGLTGDALAEKAGIAGDFLRRIETGRSWVSPKTLEALSKALRAPVHELFLPRRK